MPDIFAASYKNLPLHSHAYGNAYNEAHRFARAAAAADKLFFGIIPAGTEVTSLELINSAIATATLTIGFEPDDALGPTAVTNQWFAAGTTVATAARRQSISQPIRFDRDVRIVAVLAAASLVVADLLTIVVNGKVVQVR